MSPEKGLFHLWCFSNVHPTLDNRWGKKRKRASEQSYDFAEVSAVCGHAEDKGMLDLSYYYR